MGRRAQSDRPGRKIHRAPTLADHGPEQGLFAAFRGPHILITLLCVLAFGVFSSGAELFWDDHLVIRASGPIAHLSTLFTAFAGRCVLFPDGYTYPYYRPIVDASFVLDYAIAGSAPFVFHATNFLLHLANSLMAWEILRRLCANRRAAFLGTAVFALHPIQVESVLWAAARPAVLGFFFAEAAALVLLCASTKEQSRGRTLGLVCGIGVLFGASLLSKEASVAILPVACLLFAAKGRATSRVIALATAACGTVLIIFLIANAAVYTGAATSRADGAGPLFTRSCEAFGFYLRSLAAPFWLTPAYARESYQSTSFLVAGLAGGIAFLATAAWGLLRREWHTLLLAAGTLFFGGSSLLPIVAGQHELADRYLYQAMFGLALMIGALPRGTKEGGDHRFLTHAGLAAVMAISILSARQSVFWLTERGMWERVVEVDPENVVGHYNLAVLAQQRGLPAEMQNHLDAVLNSERGTELPERPRAAIALANLVARADPNRALSVLQVARDSPEMRTEAVTLSALIEYGRNHDDAGRAYAAQIEDNGDLPPMVYFNLGRIAFREGDRVKAAALLEKAKARGLPDGSELEVALKNAPTLSPGRILTLYPSPM
ncbi:hypothetical protein BH09SUM1_BH09SUM1_31540 [soil metagenome]